MYRKGKRVAVMAMALALTVTGIGFYGGNVPLFKDSAITASAVQKIEVNPYKYGCYPSLVDKAIIRNGDMVLKELDSASFEKGYTLSGNSEITVELFHNGSSTLYNATTGELISHTGRTIEAPKKNQHCIPIAKLLEVNNCNQFFFYNIVDFYSNSFLTATTKTREQLKYEYLEKGIEYLTIDGSTGNNHIILVGMEHSQSSATGESKTLRKFNTFTMEFEGDNYLTDDLNQSRADRIKLFSLSTLCEKFLDCNSIEITIGSNHEEQFATNYVTTGTLLDNNKKLVLTPKDLTVLKEVEISTNIKSPLQTMRFSDLCSVKVYYDDGYEKYAGIADCLRLVEDGRRETPVKDENGDIAKDIFGGNVYPAVNDNGEGKGFISEKTLDYADETGESIFWIYKNGDKSGYVDRLNLNSVIAGYEIYNFTPETDNYYIEAITYDEGKKIDNIIWYKYDNKLNAWVRTVDTREQVGYPIKVNSVNFPETVVYGDNSGTVITKDVFGNIVSNKFYKIANGDINKGNTSFNINIKEANAYTSYEINAGKDSGSSEYKLNYVIMGTDVECTNADVKLIDIEIKNNDGKNHSYTVDGVTEDDGSSIGGKEVHTEFDDNGEDLIIRLPDGEYDIVRDDGYKEHIVVDGDDSEKKNGSVGEDGTYNSDSDDGKHKKGDKAELTFDPNIVHNFVIKTPDGKTDLFKGDVIDEALDNIEDLIGRETPDNKNKIEDVLVECPYFKYDENSGITNSANPDDYKSETGFIVVDDKGNLIKKSILKGDVNLDGKIGISDLVLAQKYLLDNLDSKTVFTIDNLIAMDMCEDGSGDVFDMVELRKTVAEKVL